jgi:hypothetical protein
MFWAWYEPHLLLLCPVANTACAICRTMEVLHQAGFDVQLQSLPGSIWGTLLPSLETLPFDVMSSSAAMLLPTLLVLSADP